MHPFVHYSIIHGSQDKETIKGSIDRMWYMHTMEYYSPIRKDKILLFVATWVDLENIILSEKAENLMISLICGK